MPGLHGDAAADAFEDKIEFFGTDMFVECVGAFGRKPPESRGEILAFRALQVIGVRNPHKI